MVKLLIYLHTQLLRNTFFHLWAQIANPFGKKQNQLSFSEDESPIDILYINTELLNKTILHKVLFILH